MIPLAGIRVLDLTNLLPGPFCSMILADLGAEVIKVEKPPHGDPARVFMPGLFAAVNRNKKSVTLDLKADGDKKIFEKLVAESDVLLESFRPGVMAKLGFGRKEVSAINKGIVYCSLSGFGEESPYRDMPGHDINFLSVAGSLSISGDPEGPPAAWGGVQIADLSSSMYAVIAVMAALRNREKSGEGCSVDVSATDCALAWMGPRIGEYYDRGQPEKHRFMGRGGYGVYETGDGRFIAVGCVEDHFWQSLCRVLSLADMAENEAYGTWQKRMEKAREINPVLQERLKTKGRDEWLAFFREADIPCSPVNAISELAHDPHIVQRRLMTALDGFPVVRFPVKFDSLEIRDVSPGTSLGSHDREIKERLGV